MNSNLLKALSEERSIFRNFSSFFSVGNYQCFYSDKVDQVPHWNMAYPTKDDCLDKGTMEAIDAKYTELSSIGHIAVESFEESKSINVDESEYFLYEQKSQQNIDRNNSIIKNFSHVTEDLELFCETVSEVFSFDENTSLFFLRKMEVMVSLGTSEFYVIKENEKVIGCCSSFKTCSNFGFLFNMAVLPESEGKGLGSLILSYIAEISNHDLLIYSYNEKMRKTILPKVGFKSLGVLHIVPLSEALRVFGL